MHALTLTPLMPGRILRRLLVAGALMLAAATIAPSLVRAQDGPGTTYIQCLDTAVDNLANCYLEADGDRWRERLCNFAYYVDSIACSVDLIF